MFSTRFDNCFSSLFKPFMLIHTDLGGLVDSGKILLVIINIVKKIYFDGQRKTLFPRGIKIISNKLKSWNAYNFFIWYLPFASIPITLFLVLEHRTKDLILKPLYFFLEQGRTIIDYNFKYNYSISINKKMGSGILV